MSTSESDPNTEILKSIATSLKAILSSLESLTGAVEGVAESIEKAHEPEGDLGVHLVSALKDLGSSLHKRAQQERSHQPQQQQRPLHPQQQTRRDDRQHRQSGQGRPDREDDQPRQHHPDREENREAQEHVEHAENVEESTERAASADSTTPSQPSNAEQLPKSGGRGRGNSRSRRGDKAPAKQAPKQ